MHFAGKKKKKKEIIEFFFSNMKLPVCSEHVTVFAFTGKTWCGACKAVEPELQLLTQWQGTDFHFAQIDDQDDMSQELFQEFQVRGVPTILLFDPKTNQLTQYQMERKADVIRDCAVKHNCAQLPSWEHRPSFELLPHPSSSSSSEEGSSSFLTLCSKCPTALAFTWLEGCGHCVEIQSKLDILKKESTFHFVQLDVKDNDDIIQQFGVQFFPTVLIYDPVSNAFYKFEVEHIDILTTEIHANPPQYPRVQWSQVPSVIELFVCAQMQAPCPSMYEASCPDMQQQNETQSSQHQYCVSLLGEKEPMKHKPTNFECCSSCPTIVVFTAEKCPPCEDFLLELQMLQSAQACGKYHVVQYEFKVTVTTDVDTMEKIMAFGIELYPTILIFQPSDKQFYHYRGLRLAREVARCDTQQSPMWNISPQLHVTVKKRDMHLTQYKVDIKTQTNGRLHLCNFCPTIIVFTAHTDVCPKLMEHDGRGLHVLYFNAKQHAVVMQLFQISIFPKVLLYDPRVHVFFVYEGDIHDSDRIKHTYMTRSLQQTWNVYPQIVAVANH